MINLPIGREWFWASEVATLCHVSPKTVYAWIDRGLIIPLLKVRPFKIPRSEVLKLLQ